MSTRHLTTEDGERMVQALAGPSYPPSPDNSVISIADATGIGVTGLAAFDNPVNWTTTSSSVWSDPWPFPPDDRQPTRAQTELLSVLGDLVLEYAQTSGPPTALLRAVRDAYQAGFHPGAPR